ncbi:MAG: aminotransferase class V-fold PLP-dependent enzyme [Myxococcota bacterium]
MRLDADALRPHYASFLQPGRILLTGHSHQAWPDVAEQGLRQAFRDAAAHVDDKWSHAAEAAEAVRSAVVAYHGGTTSQIALAANTHELLTRLFSALDLRRRPRFVATTGEFHSIRRQLMRLEEEGIEVCWVDAEPVATLAERLAAAVTDRTAALLTSTTLFQTSSVVPHLEVACEAAHAAGAEVVLDAYHHTGIVPWCPVDAQAYVVGGGYKYLQWGEGCGFMRVPEDCTLRPVITGWFSDFGNLERGIGLGYGTTHGDRFAGATYDPSSHYRARAVIDHFAACDMTIENLRETSLAQTERILNALDGYEVLTPREGRGGFVTVRIPNAPEIAKKLRAQNVFVDARGDLLRLGPAPYLRDDEIDAGVHALKALCPASA